MYFSSRFAMRNLIDYIKQNNINPDIKQFRLPDTQEIGCKHYTFNISDEIGIEFSYSHSQKSGAIFIHLKKFEDVSIISGPYSSNDVEFEDADCITQKEIYDFIMSYER